MISEPQLWTVIYYKWRQNNCEHNNRQHQQHIRWGHCFLLDSQPLVLSLRGRRYEPPRKWAQWTTILHRQQRIAERYQGQSGSYHVTTRDNTRVLQYHHRCPFPRFRLSKNSIEMNSHRLTDTHKKVHVNICQSLPLRLHRKEFLKNLVTGDESWILYDNDARHAIWLPRDAEPPTQSKPNPTNANISSSFGATRKGRYTTSCFLQTKLSQLPSTSINFKNWSA